MKKIFFLFFFMISSLLAIEIKIAPDMEKNITAVSADEANAMKTFLKKWFKFHISDQGAYNVVRDNRILANLYLQKYKLNKNNEAYIKIIVERYLADKYVEDYQNRHAPSMVILRSYYYDHLDDFKKEDQVSLVFFTFNEPQKAWKFYNDIRSKDFQYIEKLAAKENIEMKEYPAEPLSKLKPSIASFVKSNKKKKGYALPPFVISNERTVVVFVKGYEEGKGYKSFESVKEDIQKKLLYEHLKKDRDEILSKYKKSVK